MLAADGINRLIEESVEIVEPRLLPASRCWEKAPRSAIH